MSLPFLPYIQLRTPRLPLLNVPRLGVAASSLDGVAIMRRKYQPWLPGRSERTPLGPLARGSRDASDVPVVSFMYVYIPCTANIDLCSRPYIPP
jgi:hypothetical protein